MRTEILRAVVGQAWSLVTAALAALVATETSEGWLRHVGLGAAITFTLFFLVLSASDARTIYRSHTAARELANLRREGWKRYTEWWTHCHEPKAAETKERAEALRLRIIALLTEKVSEAEADYFNTPKAVEAFPFHTTLAGCPENILINHFAHRLERLGEIIQRIKQRGGGSRTLS
jgi:hypothetical protein